MKDCKQDVVDAIRKTLPEFCKLNGIKMDDWVMSNLANWVTGAIPVHVYRVGCGGKCEECCECEMVACACTGYCLQWFSIHDKADA